MAHEVDPMGSQGADLLSGQSAALRRKRIANIHIMRTAGTYVSARLCEILGSEYDLRVSWFAGLDRDWSKAELVEFSRSEGPIFVHNHVVNWDLECVQAYRQAGFLLFTFVRDVGDQLCSLYFLMDSRKEIPPGLGLEEFIRIQVSGGRVSEVDYRHWEIPAYWGLLDYAAVFTEAAFVLFVTGALGVPWLGDADSGIDRNQSQNRGYRHYCQTGDIARQTQELVAGSEFQRRFLAVQGRPGGVGEALPEQNW